MGMDDDSIHRLIQSVAPVLRRNYVCMEVQNNLTVEGRRKLLAQFDGPEFKKVAMVVMGEPPGEYKSKMQAFMLKEKRQKAVAEVKRKRQELDRRKAMAD